MNFSPARSNARWTREEEENANGATSTYWTESYSSWFFGLVFFARFLSAIEFYVFDFIHKCKRGKISYLQPYLWPSVCAFLEFLSFKKNSVDHATFQQFNFVSDIHTRKKEFYVARSLF
jgi:hypothetical protein